MKTLLLLLILLLLLGHHHHARAAGLGPGKRPLIVIVHHPRDGSVIIGGRH